MHINFDSFSHGQILSKLWLCENLEKYLPKTSNVLILGSWYNILGFLLLTRNHNRYSNITAVDIDPDTKSIADKICNYWTFGENEKIKNVTQDANKTNSTPYNVVINCSVEHMESNDWFSNIKPNTLVCIQSSDVTDKREPWLIVNPNSTLNELKEKYPLSQILFIDEKSIRYENWGYKRFMIIGIK